MNENVTVKYKHKRLQRSPDSLPLLSASLPSAHPKEEGTPHHGHVTPGALTPLTACSVLQLMRYTVIN